MTAAIHVVVRFWNLVCMLYEILAFPKQYGVRLYQNTIRYASFPYPLKTGCYAIYKILGIVDCMTFIRICFFL